MLLSLVYFVKVINQRDVVENFAESAQCVSQSEFCTFIAIYAAFWKMSPDS